MDWFIKKAFGALQTFPSQLIFWKGRTVEEDTPLRIDYFQLLLVALGHPSNIKVGIETYSDPNNIGAPMYHGGMDSGSRRCRLPS